MGIKGLLGFLKSSQTPSHVEEFSGKTLGVDGYVWLHKGVFTCAHELAFQKDTDKYIKYAIHQALMLQYYGVKPIVVFDGGPLPCKAPTEQKRKERREEAFKFAKKLWDEGKRSQAFTQFSHCVDVTPEMAAKLIAALKEHGISSIVAPYEADSQLVYLEKEKVIDGIITEDSDMLVFGAKRVLFKMDGFGNCVQIQREDLFKKQEVDLRMLSDEKFRHMSIFSGCDYTDGIAGMGLKTALRYIIRYPDPRAAIRAMRLDKSLKVPIAFEKEFLLADLAFQHQRVYCPKLKRIVHMSPISRELSPEEDAYIGPFIEDQIAIAIAEGRFDPVTKSAFTEKNTMTNFNSPRKENYTESTKRKGITKTDISTFFMGTRPPNKRPKKIASMTCIPSQERPMDKFLPSQKQESVDSLTKGEGGNEQMKTPQREPLSSVNTASEPRRFDKSLSDVSHLVRKSENIPPFTAPGGCSKYFAQKQPDEKNVINERSLKDEKENISIASPSPAPKSWFSSFSYETSTTPRPSTPLSKIGQNALNRKAKRSFSLQSPSTVSSKPSSTSLPERPKGVLSLQHYKFR
ncbi:exonuclease I Exo1 [Schizosaccharomyces cryophilus OY26]|uniref:Exonuclease 1 n=1 Tax=Schizosaccharomyces cryophilus (strain OY26 / ATCC MYA-4695 / CBS 11777 / NBRC 106824 / NRRL Y48691) TaxID=653667 RepID=S9VV19_SCHCR|nr:exonuclease I Exo1 [Schizosaccharomyces cryophilus OY26]EPY51638.1 exonuclease I Exo1 [Schizosaccharomyces cryophilus OY26]